MHLQVSYNTPCGNTGSVGLGQGNHGDMSHEPIENSFLGLTFRRMPTDTPEAGLMEIKETERITAAREKRARPHILLKRMFSYCCGRTPNNRSQSVSRPLQTPTGTKHTC